MGVYSDQVGIQRRPPHGEDGCDVFEDAAALDDQGRSDARSELSLLAADCSVNELTDEIGVAVVPGVLLNHVDVDPPE